MKKNTLFALVMAIAAAFIIATSFVSCNVFKPSAGHCPTNDPNFFYKHPTGKH